MGGCEAPTALCAANGWWWTRAASSSSRVRRSTLSRSPSITLALLLICLLISFVQSLREAQTNKTLLWLTNKSGLFSQFFQLRQMVRYAHRYKRRLVIANFSSSHFSGETNSLCDVFSLPLTISCDKGTSMSAEERNQTLASCLTSFSSRAFRANNATSLCYKGATFGSRGLVSDHKRLQLIAGEPKIRFNKRYLQLYDEHVQPRLPTKHTYTVAHWRRGDQLTTRCKRSWVGLKDTSVNCRSAGEFIADVRGSLGGNNRETILVATNEHNESSLSVLRRAEGFYILSELLRATSETKSKKLTEIDEFVLETLVMLRAPSLLTSGISTINDLIESARKENRQSYCKKKDQDLNWCTIANNAA